MSSSLIQEFLKLSPRPDFFAGGAYSRVYLHPNNTTIIKRIKYYDDNEEFPRADMLNEIAILSKIKNEANIIQMPEFFFSYSKRTLYIALEKGRFDGLRFIYILQADSDYQKNVLNTFHHFFYDLALGVEQLHKHNILHGDLKLQNIIFYDDEHRSTFKIIDYGISKPHACLNYPVDSYMYTKGYKPPEILFDENSEGIIGFPADIWALGVIIYEMYVGTTYMLMEGFKDGLSRKEKVRQFLKNKEILLKNIKDEKLKNLLSKMLSEDQYARPNIYEILTDEYFLENGLKFKGKYLTCLDKLLLECPEKINLDFNYDETLKNYSEMIEIIKNGYARYNKNNSYQFEFSELNDLILESTWFLYAMVRNKFSEEDLRRNKVEKQIILACLMIYVKIYGPLENNDMFPKLQIKII